MGTPSGRSTMAGCFSWRISLENDAEANSVGHIRLASPDYEETGDAELVFDPRAIWPAPVAAPDC
jgi:hypothetical protein